MSAIGLFLGEGIFSPSFLGPLPLLLVRILLRGSEELVDEILVEDAIPVQDRLPLGRVEGQVPQQYAPCYWSQGALIRHALRGEPAEFGDVDGVLVLPSRGVKLFFGNLFNSKSNSNKKS